MIERLHSMTYFENGGKVVRSILNLSEGFEAVEKTVVSSSRADGETRSSI